MSIAIYVIVAYRLVSPNSERHLLTAVRSQVGCNNRKEKVVIITILFLRVNLLVDLLPSLAVYNVC
jgi:hypothetical protein